MREFLGKEGAALYHITPMSNWVKIKEDGTLLSTDKKIFVCRSSDPAMHYSIATRQIPEVYTDGKFVVLRLPQLLNNFNEREFEPDFQATEVTMPFQSILLRQQVLLEDIEFVEEMEVGDIELENRAGELNASIANSAEFIDALATEYILPAGAIYHLQGELPPKSTIWTFSKIF